MPRREEVFQTGHYYHVYNRGDRKLPIFFNDENYLYCIKLAKKYSQKYKIAVIAYCLMPNHYHFLLRQDGDTAISRFMGVLFNAYVQAVNKEQERSGTLFEGRFKFVLIDKEEYLIHLCRYIHLNPVKAGLVSQPRDWQYSNYLEWVNKRDGVLIDRNFVNHWIESSEAYNELLTEGMEFSGLDDYLLE